MILRPSEESKAANMNIIYDCERLNYSVEKITYLTPFITFYLSLYRSVSLHTLMPILKLRFKGKKPGFLFKRNLGLNKIYL